MNTAGAVATAQRLEARAKALAQVLDARARDQRAAVAAALAGVNAAYHLVRARGRLSSFICAAFAEFLRGNAARAAALEAGAQQTLAAAQRALGERRHWGALTRGLQRRARRLERFQSWRA